MRKRDLVILLLAMAAAVTVAQIRLTAARPGAQTAAVMTVDRPYLFFITDTQESNILFAGRIMNI
mgnify:CR=1 FL=1